MRAFWLCACCLAWVCNCESSSSSDAMGGSSGHAPADASHDTGTDATQTGGAGGTTADSGAGDAMDAETEADACKSIYTQIGCGDAAPKPLCSSGVAGACSGTFCSCNGQTIYGNCAWALEPFAAIGACDAGGD